MMGEARADVLLSTFKALGMVLAPRLTILLALIGAFALAIVALLKSSLIALSVFAAYCLLTIVPLVVSDLWARLHHGSE